MKTKKSWESPKVDVLSVKSITQSGPEPGKENTGKGGINRAS